LTKFLRSGEYQTYDRIANIFLAAQLIHISTNKALFVQFSA